MAIIITYLIVSLLECTALLVVCAIIGPLLDVCYYYDVNMLEVWIEIGTLNAINVKQSNYLHASVTAI